MAPQASLRGILSYAAQLVAQIPFSAVFDTPAIIDGTPPSPSAPSLLDGVGKAPPASSPPYVPLSGAPACPIDGPTSCHSSAPAAGDDNGCCFVYPGGRMLLAQFWDREVHAGGGDDDWTVHGLWPDKCDGSYDSYCYRAPGFENVTEILEHHGQGELVEFMEHFWVAKRGGSSSSGSSNARFWAHEWNKHGTCINTLRPACYGDSYAAGVEVVDYFARAVALFRTLDTYGALARAGITPAHSRHYPLAEMRDILESFSGGRAVLRCSGPRRDILHEVWYVYFVRGSLQSGDFVPAQDLGERLAHSNCVPWVRYLPKVGQGR